MKKVKNVLVKLSLTLIIVSVFSIVFFDHSNREIFGYKVVSVKDDSMIEAGFDQDDLIVIKNINPFVLGKDDIITFRSTNPGNYFEITTHKIRERTIDKDNYPGFITYDLSTGQDDNNLVKYEYILGKYTGTLKGAGIFFRFLKTTLGYICCIFLPFTILMFIFIINRLGLAKAKKNKLDEKTTKARMSRVKVNGVNNKNEIVMPKIRKTRRINR